MPAKSEVLATLATLPELASYHLKASTYLEKSHGHRGYLSKPTYVKVLGLRTLTLKENLQWSRDTRDVTMTGIVILGVSGWKHSYTPHHLNFKTIAKELGISLKDAEDASIITEKHLTFWKDARPYREADMEISRSREASAKVAREVAIARRDAKDEAEATAAALADILGVSCEVRMSEWGAPKIEISLADAKELLKGWLVKEGR